MSVLIGTYSGDSDTGKPPRISDWLGPIGAFLGLLLLLALGVRRLRASTGRRLASVSPTAWWSCPECRSLNASGTDRCYSCGHAWDPSIPALGAPGEDLAEQAIGRRLDR